MSVSSAVYESFVGLKDHLDLPPGFDRESVLGKRLAHKTQKMRLSGVVKLALLGDSMRALAAATSGRCVTSSGPFRPLRSWYAYCAKTFARTGASRYVSFENAEASEVDHFARLHHQDTELFGGGSAETAWLGLRITKSVSEHLGSREPVAAYHEFIDHHLSSLVIM